MHSIFAALFSPRSRRQFQHLRFRGIYRCALRRPKSDVTKITMMTFVCDDPSSCGVVKQDSQGVITEYYEKVSNPPADIANAAVFMVEPFVLEFMKTKTPAAFDFCADVLPHFIGRMFGWANDGYHKDIGTIETYREALTDFETLTRQKNAE